MLHTYIINTNGDLRTQRYVSAANPGNAVRKYLRLFPISDPTPTGDTFTVRAPRATDLVCATNFRTGAHSMFTGLGVATAYLDRLRRYRHLRHA